MKTTAEDRAHWRERSEAAKPKATAPWAALVVLLDDIDELLAERNALHIENVKMKSWLAALDRAEAHREAEAAKERGEGPG